MSQWEEAGLKIPREKSRAGSSPAPGTIKNNALKRLSELAEMANRVLGETLGETLAGLLNLEKISPHRKIPTRAGKIAYGSAGNLPIALARPAAKLSGRDRKV